MDAVDRKTPLSKEHQVRRESLRQQLPSLLHPGEEGFELSMPRLARDERAAILSAELTGGVDGEPDVGSVDLLFYNNFVRQELACFRRRQDFVPTHMALAEQGDVRRAREAEEVHQPIFSACFRAISSGHRKC